MTRLICITLIAATFFGCTYTADIISDYYIFGNELREPTYDVFERSDELTTADGIKLVADIYLPAGLEKAPTILVRIPFTDTLSNRFRSQVISRGWARRGYAVMIQGTRGRYHSGGTFYPLIHERTDGIETIKWIAQQPWYDGRLAMWGGSAFGHTQWVVADQINPGPSAFAIQISSSRFRDMLYPGGAFSLESALYWTMRSSGSHDRTADMPKLQRSTEHLPLADIDNIAIEDTDFFNDWLIKRDDSAYWDEINGNYTPEAVHAPILLVGGWFDPFLPRQLIDFQEIKSKSAPLAAKESRLIIGPWSHADEVKLPNTSMKIPYRAASVNTSLPWFDHILGLSNEQETISAVRIFVMGINRWRNENEWPLARTKYISMYLCSERGANSLSGDGRLVRDTCKAKQNYSSYRYDPANPVPTAGGAMLSPRAGIELQNGVEERNDVLVFSTPPLKEDTEVTGPIRAILYVATDVPSTDFTAKLVDVHPDGSAYNISDGIVRQNYRGTIEDIQKIEINLWPTSNVFLGGHSIRVEISSSNFPRYDRNLNTGDSFATVTGMQTAQQHVFHTENYPSHIVLPVIDDYCVRYERHCISSPLG